LPRGARGHLDTDKMKGMKKKEQGDIVGDMICGRGAADMKGAVAVMMCAAKRLTIWGIPFTIVLTTDGLGEQQGAEALARNPVIQNSRGILMIRPTGLKPVAGQVGYAAIKVRTHGSTAVMDMAAFLKMLAGQMEESAGKLAVKTGLIKGGKKKKPFESPDACEVVLEIETTDSTDTSILAIKGLLIGMDYEFEVLCLNDMVEFDLSSELAIALNEQTRNEPAFQLVHSEAAKIVPVNQKIVVWGPGNSLNAASEQEYVTLSDLEMTYETILTLMDRLSPLEE
jgi:acetylornithine deacetylase/succinyl-diaminopimelate desuccinylase-like protein